MKIGPRLIEITKYSFSIGGCHILRDISIAVNRGEFICVIGPNGSGKSTLLKCLNRLNRGGAGRILIDGRPLEHYQQRALARRLAYLPQDNSHRVAFNVYDFVSLGRYPHLSPFTRMNAEDDRAVQRAMDRTETSSLAERRVDTLSGGERQRVFLAAALAQESDVLLLDEPTSALDPRHCTEIHRMLKAINRDLGVTILCTTHDINGALYLADRIIALKNGSILSQGPTPDFPRGDLLNRLYEQSFVLFQHPRNGHPMVVPDTLK